MIGTEYLVLRTLPAISPFDPTVSIECHCRSFIRTRLSTKTRVLLFDLLNLLRLYLLATSTNVSFRDACVGVGAGCAGRGSRACGSIRCRRWSSICRYFFTAAFTTFL